MVSKDKDGNEIEGLELPFHETGENAGNPKPLILVGQNGSGKSTILSFVVNSFFLMKKAAFSKQNEIEKDLTFRLRGDIQIKEGADSYWSDIEFQNGNSVKEFRSNLSKEAIGKDPVLKPRFEAAGKGFGINNAFRDEKHKDDYKKGVFLYFPPNRFEEPIWLNSNSLNLAARFEDPNKFEGETNRKIIQQSPLKEVKNWLMDLLLDEFNYESERDYAVKLKFIKSLSDTHPDISKKLDEAGFYNKAIQNVKPELAVFPKTDGVSVNIRKSLNKFLGTFLGKDGVRTGFNDRKSRLVGVYKDEVIEGKPKPKQLIPDLFAMSSGEVSLFCMFCAILRDADLADLFDKKSDDSQWKNLKDIEGIVVIDEIDLHLHTKMQSEILPKLIALFPKIQFIITTHSPLFLLGMEAEFEEENIEIIKLENGKSEKILSAYKWEETVEQRELLKGLKLKRELKKKRIPEINKLSEQVIVLTEGETDRDYLKRAIKFKREEAENKNPNFLSDVAIESINGGDGGIRALNAFYEIYEKEPQRNKKIILLYDCDAESNKEVKDLQKKKVNNLEIIIIPKVNDSPISKGIENLLPLSLIQKEEINKFFYSCYVTKKSGSKKPVTNPATEFHIPDSSRTKKNLCNHITKEYKNASADDFKNFDQIFKMIEEVLNSANHPSSEVK